MTDKKIDIDNVVIAILKEYDNSEDNHLGIRLIINTHDRDAVVAGFLSLMRMMDKNEDLRDMFRDANAVNRMIREGVVDQSFIGDNMIIGGKKNDRKDMS